MNIKNSFLVIVFVSLSSLSLFGMERKEASASLPILSEHMTKEEWQNFAKVGGGYFPIPKELRELIPPTVALAKTLNRSCSDKPGYHCEEKQQLEIFFYEKDAWPTLPDDTGTLACGMSELAVSILQNVLRALGIDESIYSKVTGGLSDSNGKYAFKISHYDPSKNLPGLLWHKDIRWITVLFINQDGLQANVEGKIIDVKPIEGYFFVNLGVYFEAFINNKEKLNAIIHQVQKMYEDRISFGVFCEGAYPQENKKGFYQLVEQELVWKPSEELDLFLVKDDTSSFNITPHKI